MKRLVLLIITLLSGLAVNAQIYVKGVPLKRNHKYVLINIKPTITGYAAFIEADQTSSILNNFKPVTNQDGKKLHFETVTAAIEFFENNGFELKAMSSSEDDNTTHFYLLFTDTNYQRSAGQ